MQPAGDGWHEARVASAGAGTAYWYRPDGRRECPDPAARALPEGVFGPAQVVDPATFAWHDARWCGLRLSGMVLYELHVGTFTPAGTFDAIIPRLSALRDLGVTAIELMPVASFPGRRNWGYDGVGLFAPQWSYGGPDGLRRLVDACHRAGLAVVLDVVYNHLGPEGNFLAEFGPYFTDRYHTPWGHAMNFEGPEGRGVRDFVLANAIHWVQDYHVDALRLDAVHGIVDASPVHIVAELSAAMERVARRLGRPVPLIAESDLNDRRVVMSHRAGGHGLAGQWSDDFHHALHALLTGERSGYYKDFGAVADLAKACTHGFVYDGQHSAYRGRRHGTPSRDLPAERFVICTQNHDQVGNRAQGERLLALAGPAAVKLAAAVLLCSPYVPLLFMGEEYGEPAPFLYFTDFEDLELREAITRGRREEFREFGWTGDVPDPEDPATFTRSRLHWDLRRQAPHAGLLAFYRRLLALRRRHRVLGPGGKGGLSSRQAGDTTLLISRRHGREAALLLLHLSPKRERIQLAAPAGLWRRILDSGEAAYGGDGELLPAQLGAGPRDLDVRPFAAALYLGSPKAGGRSGERSRRGPARRASTFRREPRSRPRTGTR